MPATLCLLSSLSKLDLGYNKLTSAPSCVTAKDVDWAQTQTVTPTAVAAYARQAGVQLKWDAVPYKADGG